MDILQIVDRQDIENRRKSHDEISLTSSSLGNTSDKILIKEISLVDNDVVTNRSDNDSDMQNLEKEMPKVNDMPIIDNNHENDNNSDNVSLVDDSKSNNDVEIIDDDVAQIDDNDDPNDIALPFENDEQAIFHSLTKIIPQIYPT